MATDRLRNIKVILDTNALLIPFQFKMNLDAELTRLLGQYEIIVPSIVTEELNNLIGSDKPAAALKAALKLSERYKKVEVEKKGDDAVIEAAEKYNGIVVTNDKLLRERLHSRGLKTISLKGRTHLEINDF